MTNADERPGRRFLLGLGAILAVGLVSRWGYLAAQPAADPTFRQPILDGAYYVEWGRAIASGAPGPEGAYYLAPLYPYLVALFAALFGESLVPLLAFQNLLSLATAALVGLVAFRAGGAAAGLIASALYTFHQPILFFASRPVGEGSALFLLVLALWFAGGRRPFAAGWAGLACGLAALARPNLLLVALFWGAGETLAGRYRRVALLAAGLALATLPVTVRNLVVSGHAVLISSNGGITAYHGNGPGARGIFTNPAGFANVGFGDGLGGQREEATRLARARSGRPLDPVEADRYWGRQALATRLGDPLGTAGLVGRRGLLMLDSREHGLDYPPLLDDNPWRLTLRRGATARQAASAVEIGRELPWLPFGLLAGLSLAALIAVGGVGSGGRLTWSAIAACAATPLLFYVSSRYRLPLAGLLAIPAGCGLAALCDAAGRRRRLAVGVAVGTILLSLAIPSRSLLDAEIAGGLLNRSILAREANDGPAAERYARLSLELQPTSAGARTQLGTILEETGRYAEATEAYRWALGLDPDHPRAASRLAGLLVRSGAPGQAVPILRRALAVHERDAPCWNALVLALIEVADFAGARVAVGEATGRGVTIDRSLLERLEGAP